MEDDNFPQKEYVFETPSYTNPIALITIVLLLSSLYFISLENYTLFHTIVELFAVVIGTTIFLTIWNGVKLLQNHFFYVIGVSFLFVACLRFFHLMAYKGLGPIFFHTFDTNNLAMQLWIAGSILQAISFFVATFYFKRKVIPWAVFLAYFLALATILLSIFYFRVFPDAFREGTGLTLFKKVSEYSVSAIFLFTILILFQNKKKFDPGVFKTIIASIILLIVSELSFTLYTDPFGIMNVFGHLAEAASIYLFYKVLVATVIYKPQNILFNDLKDREEALRINQTKLRKYAKELETEKNEDEALLASIGDGVVATDSCGRIIFANGALIELFGLEHSVIINRNLDTVLPLIDEQGEKVNIDNRPLGSILKSVVGKRKVTKSDKYFFKRKDKSIIRLMITASPVLSKGRITGIVGVYRDITKEKDLERTKSEFVSFAAHQLRTPLTTLGLTTELLSGKKKLDKETKENLDYLKKDISNMSRLVNTFLNVSRIEMGRINIIPELDDVKPMISDAIERAKSQAKEKKIDIETSIDPDIPYIKVDQNVLNIIIENLLTNAIKYTPDNGKISLLAESNKKQLLIEIADSGMGIPKAEQGKVFDRMFRADNVNRSEGMGLGLYLVRSLVKQCGGKVWFESPSPQYIGTEIVGTTFYFSLPLSGMKSKEIK